MKTQPLNTILILLRIGVAFAFLYPPVSAFLNPDAWIWFVPDFVEIVLPKEIFLQVFGVFEVVLGLAVLFMKNVFWPALISAGVLGAIIVLDLSAFDVVFRDIPILLMALALAYSALARFSTPHSLQDEAGQV